MVIIGYVRSVTKLHFQGREIALSVGLVDDVAILVRPRRVDAHALDAAVGTDVPFRFEGVSKETGAMAEYGDFWAEVARPDVGAHDATLVSLSTT